MHEILLEALRLHAADGAQGIGHCAQLHHIILVISNIAQGDQLTATDLASEEIINEGLSAFGLGFHDLLSLLGGGRLASRWIYYAIRGHERHALFSFILDILFPLYRRKLVHLYTGVGIMSPSAKEHE